MNKEYILNMVSKIILDEEEILITPELLEQLEQEYLKMQEV